jgi:hypothetical protein
MGESVNGESGRPKPKRGRSTAKRREEAANEEEGARIGVEGPGTGTEEETPIGGPPDQVVVEHLPEDFKAKPGKKGKGKKTRVETAQKVIVPTAQARDMLIFMFNAMVGMSIGEYAKLTDQEYYAIAAPLERILQRMPQEASEKFGEYADPLMLIMGMGMWGFRVFYTVPKIVAKEREKAAMRQFEDSISRDVPLDPSQPAPTPTPAPQPAPSPATNGTVDTNPTGDTIPTGIRSEFQQLWEQPLD